MKVFLLQCPKGNPARHYPWGNRYGGEGGLAVGRIRVG